MATLGDGTCGYEFDSGEMKYLIFSFILALVTRESCD